jgi:hypothetical protein
VSISPDGSYSVSLLANKWFDFDTPGTYLLEVAAVRPIATEHGGALNKPVPGRVNINVGPRDEDRLRGICATLYGTAVNPEKTAAALEAIETLSHIRDSTAVPYLSLLVSTRQTLAPLAIRGLERVADGAAVEALIAHASNPSTDIRELARSSLTRVGESTPDPEIRRKIGAALRP